MPDLLTGLPSHRDLEPTVADGEPPALLVDIDSFIWVNDQFGVEVGNQALVTIARELAQLFRLAAPTRIFRAAGDTFLVVLPPLDVDPIDAASRVVKGIRALNIPYRRSDRQERTQLEVNVVVVRLTLQRLSQCFGSAGITPSYAEFFGELVYREKLRRGGQPGVVVDAR
jgi:diguanylate cyclase (GGDEF)-like protein